jgi:hypothetical protein
VGIGNGEDSVDEKCKNMKLIELINQIDSIDDNLIIFVSENMEFDENINAVAAPNYQLEGGGKPKGMVYLLEVNLAKEAIEVWKDWRSGKEPTDKDKCQAVIHYAIYDSYLPT